MKPRYLSKSRFKIALECPTKLFYSGKKEIYEDSKLDDDFLKALAKGGFQVGALSQAYRPGGIEVKTLDYEKALAETNELLKRDNVVVFEAALRFENLFVRVDILEKTGNDIRLIEVKSKSADPNEFYDELWYKAKRKKGEYKLLADWRSYIFDLAFQSFVASNAFPKFNWSYHLECPDKTTVSSVDGLNQKFRIKDSNGRTTVVINGDVTPKALGSKVLCTLDLNEAVAAILDGSEMSMGSTFRERVEYFSASFNSDEKIPPIVSKACKKCEFRTDGNNLKSGFNECWMESRKLTLEECRKPFVFDIASFRGSDKLMSHNIFLMEKVDEEQIQLIDRPDGKNGLSQSARQRLQIQKYKEKDPTPYVDEDGLFSEIRSWIYPLNFIDFETSMVAIPFHKNKRPYEQVAFQFSHHLVHADGKIEHAAEYINARPGAFPNFDFVRALKKALGGNSGTIFRYSTHENSVLRQIHTQLGDSKEPDRESLMHFIESITQPREKDEGSAGSRNMVDLCELVQRFFYHPLTKGSNSLKAVLPAILSESQALKSKYSKAIYGAAGGIRSTHFKDKAWLEFDAEGNVINPYRQLESVFKNFENDGIELLMGDDAAINNGGTAMMAYAYLQFVEMSDQERSRVEESLLQYCELDTFAMVLIWEYWVSLLKNQSKSKTI